MSINQIRLYGFDLWNTDQKDCALRIIDGLDKSKPRTVYFINAHCVNVAASDKQYNQALQNAYALLPDGVGMELSAKLAGIPQLGNLNGTDMFPYFLEEAERRKLKVGFIGAKPGVAATCQYEMQARFPKLTFGIIEDGYQPQEQLVEKIKKNPPDILFVAMGVPMQEIFIHRYQDILGVSLLLGVGALFDFYSGNVNRAPKIWRTLRMEWLHRLILDPKRLWRRYLVGNLVFLVRMAALRLRGRDKLQNQLA